MAVRVVKSQSCDTAATRRGPPITRGSALPTVYAGEQHSGLNFGNKRSTKPPTGIRPAIKSVIQPETAPEPRTRHDRLAFTPSKFGPCIPRRK